MTMDLIIDVDDCVANLRDLVSYALSVESGRNVHWKDWTSYRLEGIYGPLDFDSIFARWRVLERAVLEDEFWIDIVTYGKARRWNVFFLSSRKWHKNPRDMTENWLLDNGIGFDEVIMVNHDESKRSVIEKWGLNPVWIIEDSPYDLAELYGSYPERLIRMERPWNSYFITQHTARNGYDVLQILRRADADRERGISPQ